MADYQLFKNRV